MHKFMIPIGVAIALFGVITWDWMPMLIGTVTAIGAWIIKDS